VPPYADYTSKSISYACPATGGFLNEFIVKLKGFDLAIAAFGKLLTVIVPAEFDVVQVNVSVFYNPNVHADDYITYQSLGSVIFKPNVVAIACSHCIETVQFFATP
jgi:hypothetical protein